MLHFQEYIDLTDYNTFRFPCRARYFIEVTHEHDIQELIAHPLYQQTTKRLFLGGGSNILFATDFFDGIVIHVHIMGKESLYETETKLILQVGAGENRNNLVRGTIDQGWVGLENLVSIPGTVGATPVQNIGAYGTEAKDHIVAVTAFDTFTGEKVVFDHDACQFGYRDSLFKKAEYKHLLITSVTYQLEKYDPVTYQGKISYAGVSEKIDDIIKQFPDKTLVWHIAQAIHDIRASKLPDLTKIGSAGSFFQNPLVSRDHYQLLLNNYPGLIGWEQTNEQVKLSAGQLIELAGYKGYLHHNVGVYDRHALVLINTGGGSGIDLMDTITLITDRVQELFDVVLTPEVCIIK